MQIEWYTWCLNSFTQISHITCTRNEFIQQPKTRRRKKQIRRTHKMFLLHVSKRMFAASKQPITKNISFITSPHIILFISLWKFWAVLVWCWLTLYKRKMELNFKPDWCKRERERENRICENVRDSMKWAWAITCKICQTRTIWQKWFNSFAEIQKKTSSNT